MNNALKNGFRKVIIVIIHNVLFVDQILWKGSISNSGQEKYRKVKWFQLIKINNENKIYNIS